MSNPSADRTSRSGGLGGNQGPDPEGPIGRHWIYDVRSRRRKGAIKVVSRPFVSMLCLEPGPPLVGTTRTRKPRVERGRHAGVSGCQRGCLSADRPTIEGGWGGCSGS